MRQKLRNFILRDHQDDSFHILDDSCSIYI